MESAIILPPDTPLGHPGRTPTPRGSACWRYDRQRHDKRRPPSELAVYPDRPPVRLHDPPGDHQPQPRAPPISPPSLPVAIEQPRQLIGGNARSRIGDAELHSVVRPAGPKSDLAPL